MKIVMVGPFGLQPKSTIKVRALQLAKALATRGHTVDIIYPSWHEPEESGKSWREDGVALQSIELPPDLPLLRHLGIVFRMLGLARAMKPDVVHCFKPKAYSGLVAFALWYLRRAGLFSGRILVDTDDWEGEGGWNEISGYSLLERAFFAWQERWCLRHADGVTVASMALETLVWSLGVSAEKVNYLPNGVARRLSVSTDPHKVRQANHLDGFKVILLFTRFFEFELERVVRIISYVRDSVPDVRLLIVGTGLFGEDERFLELAQEAGLGESVVCVGWLPEEELADYFAASDVAIYPYDDNLVNRAKCSVKLLMLLAAGVPVVADAVGQNREYIEHGVTGLLVRGDESGFADLVVSILRDADLGRRLGSAAQQQVQQDFDWGRLAVVAERAYCA